MYKVGGGSSRKRCYTVVSFFQGPVLMLPVASDPNRKSSCRLPLRLIVALRLRVAWGLALGTRGSVCLGCKACSLSSCSMTSSLSACLELQLYVSESCWHPATNGPGDLGKGSTLGGQDMWWWQDSVSSWVLWQEFCR